MSRSNMILWIFNRSFLFLFICQPAFSLNLKPNFLKFNVARPGTFHFLIYESSALTDTIDFDLEPLNNERVGFFFSIQGLLLGYAADVFPTSRETETVDIFISNQHYKNTKLTFNYQTLEGFNTLASRTGFQRESQFLRHTKSIKYELFGQHNLHTFLGRSLFNHFFLNQIDEHDEDSYAISLVSNWSLSRFKLESSSNILFSPTFISPETVSSFDKINAFSAHLSLGPMLSVRLNSGFRFFLETRIGTGYFENLNSSDELKKTGFETIRSYGLGGSWTSSRKKSLFNFRIWQQEGRHINTSFGELSYVYFL